MLASNLKYHRIRVDWPIHMKLDPYLNSNQIDNYLCQVYYTRSGVPEAVDYLLNCTAEDLTAVSLAFPITIMYIRDCDKDMISIGYVKVRS